MPVAELRIRAEFVGEGGREPDRTDMCYLAHFFGSQGYKAIVTPSKRPNLVYLETDAEGVETIETQNGIWFVY